MAVRASQARGAPAPRHPSACARSWRDAHRCERLQRAVSRRRARYSSTSRSFRLYREGELWAAHRQFCEQFLNPLLLAARFGIPHHAWYRGCAQRHPNLRARRAMAGARLASLRATLVHVLLPATRRSTAPRNAPATSDGQDPRPRAPAEGVIAALLDAAAPLVAGLEQLGFSARRHGPVTPSSRTYDAGATSEAKRAVVAAFASAAPPDHAMGPRDATTVSSPQSPWSRAPPSADRLRRRSRCARRLPCVRADARAASTSSRCYQDTSNPSPAQGWLGRERAVLAATAARRTL